MVIAAPERGMPASGFALRCVVDLGFGVDFAGVYLAGVDFARVDLAAPW